MQVLDGQITHTIAETESRIGGIVGVNTGIVKQCYNSTNINSNTIHVGGIVGFNVWEIADSGTIENCYNTGNITGYAQIGGIVGTNYKNGILENCYNIGNIKATIYEENTPGTNYEGGIAGTNYNTIQNCYYLEGTATGGISCTDVVGQAEVRISTYMKTSRFVGLLGNSNWKIVSGVNNGYPILKWQEGTEITTNDTVWFFNAHVPAEGTYASYGLSCSPSNGVSSTGTITLAYGNRQYGPYITLEPGTYQVRYVGNNLNKGSFTAYTVYNSGPEGQKVFDITQTTSSENNLIYTFNVTSYTTHVEFICDNYSSDSSDIAIKFIELIKLN